MKRLGMVASKREFSRIWLGRGKTYLADFPNDDRLDAGVPDLTVDRLRHRLVAVATRSPAGVRLEIGNLVEEINKAVEVHRVLAR